MFSKLFELSSQCFHVSLYQGFECLLFFIGLFLCFSVLSAHSFINLVKPWITYWKLLLFLMISKSLQRVLIVICDSWLFIRILKRGISAVPFTGFWWVEEFSFFSLEFSIAFESNNNWWVFWVKCWGKYSEIKDFLIDGLFLVEVINYTCSFITEACVVT